MIEAYHSNGQGLARSQNGETSALDAIWLDVIEPTHDEEHDLEALLGLDLPTREEMQEIEISSRLYTEGPSLFMTAVIPAQADGDNPIVAPVTFALTNGKLVTIRYHNPSAFALFRHRAAKGEVACKTGEDTLISLLDALIDRLADILERVGRDIEALSRQIFAKTGAPRRDRTWRQLLEEVGRKGDMVSVVRDSLGTLDRLTVFFGQKLRKESITDDVRARLKDLTDDIRGLTDHSGFVAQKVTFLLDAALGMIGIEQNGIVKILSVVSVVFLPPTLIASIYGMNFDHMPELSKPYAYPIALVAIVLSAVLPFLYFRLKRWL